MVISAKVLDLNAFSNIGDDSVAPGRLFIDHDRVGVLSAVKGEPLTVMLVGPKGPEVFLRHRAPRPNAIALCETMRVVARPLSDPQPVQETPLNLVGWLLPGPKGACIGCTFSYGPPDHFALSLADLEVYVHSREVQAAYQQWQIDWINPHGETVFQLSTS